MLAREIKFRAKRKDNTPHNGRWVYGQYFKAPLTDENSGASADAGWYFLAGVRRHCIVQDGVSFVIDVETLGQYTGLIVNKKEVYERDIVNAIYDGRSFVGIVVFDVSELDFKVTNGREDYGNNFQYLTCCEEVEVMGNVDDNPELLQVSAQ